MGLDNGIELRNVTPEIEQSLPCSWIHSYGSKKGEVTKYYELCYMRKWWGVRDDIVWFLERKYHFDETTCGDYLLDEEDLKEIRNILLSWHDKGKWEEEGRSIWDYEENEILQQLETKEEDLLKLISLKRLFPNLQAYFYDSY